MNQDAIPYHIYELRSTLGEENWLYFIRNESNVVIVKIGNLSIGMTSERISHSEIPAIYLLEKNRLLVAKKGEQGILLVDDFDLTDNTLIAQLIICIRKEVLYQNSNQYYLTCLLGALLKQIRKHKSVLNISEDNIQLITPFQLRRLEEFVQKNLTQSVTLTEMADFLGYSSYHFCRIFKRTMNASPKQWLKELRMQKALKLLYEGNTNVASVSYKIGYKNLSHFSKVFRSKYGYTPSQVLLT